MSGAICECGASFGDENIFVRECVSVRFERYGDIVVGDGECLVVNVVECSFEGSVCVVVGSLANGGFDDVLVFECLS